MLFSSEPSSAFFVDASFLAAFAKLRVGRTVGAKFGPDGLDEG